MCIQLPDQLMPAPSAPQNGESAASVMPPDQPTSTGITPEHLKSALRTRIEAEHVEIADLSGGCGQMFEAIIVSPQFVKKTTLARHRLVNGALREEIATIHAWTPKCFTPGEWEKKQEAG